MDVRSEYESIILHGTHLYLSQTRRLICKLTRPRFAHHLRLCDTVNVAGISATGLAQCSSTVVLMQSDNFRCLVDKALVLTRHTRLVREACFQK